MQQIPIDPQVKTEIQRILLDALALGWEPQQIWESRFWNITEAGNRPGLAALMKPGDKLGEVTESYIETIKPSGVVHKFYRPGWPYHPWIKKEDKNG